MNRIDNSHKRSFYYYYFWELSEDSIYLSLALSSNEAHINKPEETEIKIQPVENNVPKKRDHSAK